MDDQQLPFLGKGWSFPPRFSANGKNVDMTSGAENVHKSVEIILATELGERAMQEDFGGGLRRFLFEPMNARLLVDVKETITNALLYHEPRILLENVDIALGQITEGMLMIQLQYTVRSTNTRFNMVYPFYIREANLQS